MAFDESNGNGMYMPVAPAYGGYGNNGFGGDWAWIIILLLCGWGGMGFGGMGGWGMGFGNMALGYDFPWLLNGVQEAGSSNLLTQTTKKALKTLSFSRLFLCPFLFPVKQPAYFLPTFI